MSRPDVVVLDYESGNVHSAVKALEAAGARVELTADTERAVNADGLLVPGVGSFGAVMTALEAAQGPRIIDRRLAGGRPVLGICVGMQVMFGRGLEGLEPTTPQLASVDEPRRAHAKNADEFWWDELEASVDDGIAGLDQWPGTVRRLRAEILPHMGWNTVDVAEGSTLFKGVEEERFYFVHSFGATEINLDEEIPYAEPIRKTYSTYGERFLAAVENGPLTATQFHPEKSGEAGIQLLRNWVDSLR
ncbi:imidazole glycerol phosphate synthase subunit HisH [Gulosibacter macacae]|uniref:Imidazole glycerol phosphate synthase subunit HisH n=1 Tax=Gulosibacter macacae TaxID=2488791 RepID=A0A3P3W0F7_9MICO|nr:imidazole glycerol phosphate synthase subunit HisH [Gulosibacter macacae]RRJ87957.1 imidazole glycerol phosphate synthase subunit HisH [Gulosibacter macacae]